MRETHAFPRTGLNRSIRFVCNRVFRLRFLVPVLTEVPGFITVSAPFFVALKRVSKRYYITRFSPCQQQYLVFKCKIFCANFRHFRTILHSFSSLLLMRNMHNMFSGWHWHEKKQSNRLLPTYLSYWIFIPNRTLPISGFNTFEHLRMHNR